MSVSTAESSSDTWPASPLAGVQRAFDLLTRGPVASVMAIDCRGVPGLPQRRVPVTRVGAVLRHPALPEASADIVWRELVGRSRRPGSDGAAWTVAVVAIALPDLRRAADGLLECWRGDEADLHTAVLTGFVDGLSDIAETSTGIQRFLLASGVQEARRSSFLAAPSNVIRLDDRRARRHVGEAPARRRRRA
jgi:hypothetical protein